MPEQRIQLVGFQKGAEGFVRVGTSTEPDMNKWESPLKLRANGGRGSGKSSAGALRTALYVSVWDGAQGMVTAPTYGKLDDSTIPALKWGLAQFGMLEGRDYQHNINQRKITALYGANPWLIWLRSTEDPKTIPGPTLAFAWMDEVHRTPFEAYADLVPALRQPGYPHQLWVTSTPSGKRHWAYQIFRREQAVVEGYTDYTGAERNRLGRYLNYQARTQDNSLGGGAEVAAGMADTYGEDSPLYRQEALGEDVLVDGLVYPMWNPERLMVDENLWPSKPGRFLAGIDFGFVNPSAIVVEGVDSDGRHYLVEEFYRARCSEQDLVREADRLTRRYGLAALFCDAADPRWIRALRMAGLPALRANKRVGSAGDISSGIGLCTRAISETLPDRTNRLYVSPKMEHFRAEIENYVEAQGSENRDPLEHPKKKGDHCLDAFRYAEMGIVRMGWDVPTRSSGPKYNLVMVA